MLGSSTSSLCRTLLGAALVLTLQAGCSKHDCELEGKQEKYFGEIALTTKGAEKCLASVNPYGCKLDEENCTPTLTAIHKMTQDKAEAYYREKLEKQGWTYVGEKVADDKSKSVAFSKGDDDELVLAFGTSGMSDAFGGKDAIEVFMMRKPSNATGSLLDKYKKK